MASLLIAQGHQVETVQLLLGHSELDHVRPYLQVSQKKVARNVRQCPIDSITCGNILIGTAGVCDHDVIRLSSAHRTGKTALAGSQFHEKGHNKLDKHNAPVSLGDLADKVGLTGRPVSMSDVAAKIGYTKVPMSLGELAEAVDKHVAKHDKN